MKNKYKSHYIFVCSLCVVMVACGGLNLFSIDDDKQLGAQVATEIEADSVQFPTLNESDYEVAYNYLKDIRDRILDTDEVAHGDEFVWELKIIYDDEVLNAFAVPGGYLYFYTGLIKFLDSADALAGVMAHEIAHAAQRHSTQALTSQYGLSLLLDAALGGRYDIVQEIAGGLATLAFSRENESEADEYSVIYLDKTIYECDGAALFFEQLLDEGQQNGSPEFLSTHPNPDNRVEAIRAKASELGCTTTPSGQDYELLKNSLPS